MPGATITRGCFPAFAGKTSGQLFPLFCLAPHGVFRVIPLARRSGGLLPRLFTLTRQLMVPGGIFSVTLSVTRNLHPGYPRFHEACRLPVFGLSSGVNKFQPAIACHVWQSNTKRDGDPAGHLEANRQFSDETRKICASLSLRFPRDFR